MFGGPSWELLQQDLSAYQQNTNYSVRKVSPKVSLERRIQEPQKPKTRLLEISSERDGTLGSTLSHAASDKTLVKRVKPQPLNLQDDDLENGQVSSLFMGVASSRKFRNRGKRQTNDNRQQFASDFTKSIKTRDNQVENHAVPDLLFRESVSSKDDASKYDLEQSEEDELEREASSLRELFSPMPEEREDGKPSMKAIERAPFVAMDLPDSSILPIDIIENDSSATKLASAGSKDKFSSFRIRELKTTRVAKTTLYEISGRREPIGARYKRKYLYKNTLEVLYEAFRTLDDTINLFFHRYGTLKRTSYLCAKIWVYIMKLRLLMQDSISHLVDEPQFLSPGFREARELQITAIRESSRVVGTAVQFIVVFQKHSEAWRFYRKPFLAQQANEIAEKARLNSEEWVKFELAMYQLSGVFERSYRAHIEIEELKIVRSLLKYQPESNIAARDSRYIETLQAMLNDLQQLARYIPDGNVLRAFAVKEIDFGKCAPVVENNFHKFRIQLAIVEDIKNMHFIQELLPEEEAYDVDDRIIQDGYEFLRDQLAKNELGHILEEDQKMWPHQMGITRVGPFRVLPLRDPSQYLVVDGVARTYVYEDIQVEGMDFFIELEGAYTAPSPVTVPKEIRASLSIPLDAESFSYFHPLHYDAHHIASYTAEQISQLKSDIEAKIRDLSPLHAIVAHGGFGYFDATGNVIQINGLAIGEDIFFDGPYFLPSNLGFMKLAEQDIHVSPVTLQEYVSKGAVSHGWVSTEADLNLFARDGGVLERELQDMFVGGFFYKYNNEENPEWDAEDRYEGGRRNYFQLINFKELQLKKVNNRNTLLLKNLEFEIKRKMKDWDVLLPQHNTQSWP